MILPWYISYLSSGTPTRSDPSRNDNNNNSSSSNKNHTNATNNNSDDTVNLAQFLVFLLLHNFDNWLQNHNNNSNNNNNNIVDSNGSGHSQHGSNSTANLPLLHLLFIKENLHPILQLISFAGNPSRENCRILYISSTFIL